MTEEDMKIIKDIFEIFDEKINLENMPIYILKWWDNINYERKINNDNLARSNREFSILFFNGINGMCFALVQ